MSSHSKCHARQGRSLAAPAGAASEALATLPRRTLTAFDRWIGALLCWQRVDHDIRRLSALSDAQLKCLGLAREEIVARVYEAALREREERR